MTGNIILIGMPGAGKSTVGVILARLTGRDFLDTDVLIQAHEGRTLQDIVDVDGYLALRAVEERTLLALECTRHVIATGGSAVYSHAAMMHLKKNGVAVYLDVDISTLKERVRDFETRGLAKRRDQSLEALFAERSVLYRRYADVTIAAGGMVQEAVCAKIMEVLSRKHGMKDEGC